MEVAKINLNISRCEASSRSGEASGFSSIPVALIVCSSSCNPEVYELQCNLPSTREGEVLMRDDFSWDTSSKLHPLGDLLEIDQNKKLIRLGNGNMVKYKHLLLLKDIHSLVNSSSAFHLLKDALLVHAVNIKDKIPSLFEDSHCERHPHSYYCPSKGSPALATANFNAISRTVEFNLTILGQIAYPISYHVSPRNMCCVKL